MELTMGLQLTVATKGTLQFNGSFIEVKQRRPRLVLGRVDLRDRSSVWTLNCDRSSLAL
jgi:hypothetical protein